jgi:hypothetical protein
VDYNETVRDPRTTASRVNRFLGGGMDTDAMVRVVAPELYRQRK